MGGHHEQFQHGQGCPLSEVQPAFPLLIAAAFAVQGALTWRDGFGRVEWQTVKDVICQMTIGRRDKMSMRLEQEKVKLKEYWNEWRCIHTLTWLYRKDETMSRIQHTFILGCATISQFLTVSSSTMCRVSHLLHWLFAVDICCSVFCPFNQLLPAGFGECRNVWVFVFRRLPEWDSCGSTRKLILLHTQSWVALNLINPLIVDKETQMQISDK